MEDAKQDYCCPNCQTVLPGESKFCPDCGQKRIHPHDHSVWHLMVESVGDFFHFESKFFATLWPLFFRPGYLTNEYLHGRRARYFQPFKLFLFISFLYFLTSGLINHKDSELEPGVDRVPNNADSTQINSDRGNYQFTLGEAYDKIFALPDDSLRRMVNKYGLNRFVNLTYPRASWYSRFMIKQKLKNRLQGSDTFRENMQKTIPKLVFILIPFMALLLKLLYIRKKITYFNHLIFSLHFLSFFFIVLLFKEFGSLIIEWFESVVYLLILVYLFIALIRVYRQKKLVSFGKLVLLIFGSLIILIVFFVTAVSISFLMI